MAAPFVWHPGPSLERDLECSWVLLFNTVSLGLHHPLFLADISEIPVFCHYSSKCLNMLISIWPPWHHHCSCSLAGLLGMSSFLQVLPHSWEYLAQFSPFICEALFTWISPPPLCHRNLFELFSHVTDRYVSFTLFRKNPIPELVLEAITSLNSHRASKVAPCHIIYGSATWLCLLYRELHSRWKDFRTLQGKTSETHLKWWVCLLHFWFARYLPNLPVRAFMAMSL